VKIWVELEFDERGYRQEYLTDGDPTPVTSDMLEYAIGGALEHTGGVSNVSWHVATDTGLPPGWYAIARETDPTHIIGRYESRDDAIRGVTQFYLDNGAEEDPLWFSYILDTEVDHGTRADVTRYDDGQLDIEQGDWHLVIFEQKEAS